MHAHLAWILIHILAMTRDCVPIRLTNASVGLNLYDVPKTWNEAQSICKQLGGTLYSSDSSERGDVLKHYQTSGAWSVHKDVWIGLHYPSAESAENFGWTTCEAQTDAGFDNWKPTEPVGGTSKRCAVVDKNHHYWTAMDCNVGNYFLCETVGGTCTYRQTQQTPVPGAIFDDVTSTETNMSDCRSRCLSETFNNTNCWALNWDSSTATDNCVLFFVSNPFYFDDTTLLQASTKELLIKDCYTFSEVNSLPSSVSVTPDVNTDPSEGCAALLVPTTAAATTTTTTTTTTPTTTSTTAIATTTNPTGAPAATTSVGGSTTTKNPAGGTTTTTTTTTAIKTTTSAGGTTTTTTTTPAITTITSVGGSTTTTIPAGGTTTITTPAIVSTTQAVAISSNLPATATTTTEESKCYCNCQTLNAMVSSRVVDPAFINLTVDEKVAFLQLRLKLNTTNLSATKRKKNSAKDDRVETQAVGYVGIIFLCIMFLPVVMSDTIRFLVACHELFKNKAQVDAIEENATEMT